MKQERFKMISSSYAFFIRDNEILLSRRFQTGYEDGKLSVPAGHVEDGESLTAALIREIHEEVNVSLSLSDFSLCHIMHRKSDDIRVDFFFRIHRWKQEPINNEPEKCNELLWTPVNSLPSDTIPYIAHAIDCSTHHILYSEFGWK